MCKRKLKILSLFKFIWIFVILSCVDSGTLGVSQLGSEDEVIDRRTQRRNRTNLRDSSERCKESNSCIETCDEIYLKASALDECYSASENVVKDIADIFDELINPKKLSDLNDIDPDDFTEFLDISHTGFLDRVDPLDKDEDGDRHEHNDDWEDLYGYDSGNARLVLEWMANEEEIVNSLRRNDKDNKIITELLIVAGQDPLHSKSSCLSDTQWDDEDNERDLHLILGFSDNAYDNVSLLTYTNSNDENDNFEEMLLSIACPNGITNCDLNYICLARYHEGAQYYMDALLKLINPLDPVSTCSSIPASLCALDN